MRNRSVLTAILKPRLTMEQRLLLLEVMTTRRTLCLRLLLRSLSGSVSDAGTQIIFVRRKTPPSLETAAQTNFRTYLTTTTCAPTL